MWTGLIRALAWPLAIAGVALILFLGGDYHGRHVTQAKWDAEKVKQQQALIAEHERVFKQEQAYANQIAQANADRDANKSELARIRAAPKPHLVCVNSTRPNTMPGLPPEPTAAATGGGELPQEPGFDPTLGLYAEADRADALVEQFRDYLNRVPH